jgi:hypothetical protein
VWATAVAADSMLAGIGGNGGGVCAVVDKATGINMPSKPVAAERIGRRRLFFFIGWTRARLLMAILAPLFLCAQTKRR